jgi:hypothetical protein
MASCCDSKSCGLNPCCCGTAYSNHAAITPAAVGSPTAGTLHLFISAGGAISQQMLRNRRLLQQEGGALTRPAALAAEQLLESGTVEA